MVLTSLELTERHASLQDNIRVEFSDSSFDDWGSTELKMNFLIPPGTKCVSGLLYYMFTKRLKIPGAKIIFGNDNVKSLKEDGWFFDEKDFYIDINGDILTWSLKKTKQNLKKQENK